MSKQGYITFPLIALNTIGSARGLIAGDFFDKDGNLSSGREGNLYTQGLRVQARISANQTAGVGKLGEFTREQMNAIQYGSEAGALGQIAQGNSLRRVFGTGAGFQESYSAMANTQADMQNYTARETTRSAREHFGNSLRGGGSSGISFADAARGNADLKHDQFAGTAEGYNEVDHKDRPFQKLAAAQTQATGDSANNTIKTLKNKVDQEINNNLAENYDSKNMEGLLNTSEGIVKQETATANKNTNDFYAGKIKAGPEDFANGTYAATQSAKAEQRSIDRIEEQARSYEYFKNQDIQETKANAGIDDKTMNTLAQSEFVRGLTDNMTQSNVGAVTGSDAMRSSGMMTGGGIVTNAGMNAMTMNSLQQNHSMMALNDRLSDNNSASLAKSMQDMGMNVAQISSIMSAKGADRANRFLAATRSSNLQGTFQGRSFNLAAGVDGQFHGSFDSSLNVRGGYNVDMGSVTAAGGYQAGGVSGMRAVGITQSGWNFATETASNAMMFAPGGGFAKGAARLGLINPNGRYHMGIGQHRNMMQNQGSITQNKGDKMSDQKLYSADGKPMNMTDDLGF